jgi:hypothetical protein
MDHTERGGDVLTYQRMTKQQVLLFNQRLLSINPDLWVL